MITWMSLGLALELASIKTDPYTTEEHACLVQAVGREASGGKKLGMAYVTEVILNRTREGWRSNGSFCSTVMWPSQFEVQRTLRPLTTAEYNEAVQVVYTYLYDNPKRLLPKDCYSFLNPSIAQDLSWYDPTKVVAIHKGHHFLVNVN